ncbi:MAG: tetratricopeptide repeat protein [Burkholderiales bacterium]
MMLRWLFKRKAASVQPPEKAVSREGPAPAGADQPDALVREVERISRHVALNPSDPVAHCSLGKTYLEMNRVEDAKVCFENAVSLRPDYAEAHYKLGNAARIQGRLDDALTCFQSAISFNPSYAEAHNNAGVVYEEKRQWNEAIASYQRALVLNPGLSQAQYNLGLLLTAQGNLSEALACFHKAIALIPDFSEAHSALGRVHREQGHRIEAMASFQTALSINPKLADAHYDLGLLVFDQGDLSDALACFRKAISLNPNNAGAHGAVGLVHKERGEWNEAIAAHRRALSIAPRFADAHNGLGTILHAQGKLSEAAASFRQAISCKPDLTSAYSNLGATLSQMGRNDEAFAVLRGVLALDPDFMVAHSNLLFCLSHDSGTSAEEVFAEHRAFGDRFEAPFRSRWPAHRNLPDPGRRLRVGFVSADLRTHAVASFIEPLWAALDPQQVEIWGYSNHVLEDKVTVRLKGLAHRWRKVIGMTDGEFADQVGKDEIDILVDLSGHTAGSRLLSFARKPAPIQVSWIGNPNTTGLKAMDYYLADRFSAPPGLLDGLFTEKIVQLPTGALFQPLEHAPAVNDLPALGSGVLTFGSFNRSDKLTAAMVALWSRVLNAVPDSRMLLGGLPDASREENLAQQFARHGVDRRRLIFHPRVEMTEYLALHHQVDLILDTFPFGGGTTSCHAAWMGVPVLTQAGKTMSSRVGLIINSNLQLPDFIAESEDAFVTQAVRWSQRLPELAALRASLRARVLESPMCQPQAAARSLEFAFRTMWQSWCEGKPPESFAINP